MRSLGLRTTLIVLLVLLLSLLSPLIYQLIQQSLTPPQGEDQGGLTLAHYQELFEGKNLVAFRNSLIFASCSTILAVSIGGYQAWVTERTNARWRRLAYVGAVIQLGIPYLIYVIAWVFILGSNGVVNGALAKLFNSDNLSILNANSLPGMILVESFIWSPLAFLMIAAALRASNPEFEEAARMSGASVWLVVRRITIPMARPAILAVGLLAFIRTLEAFDVPAIIGLPGNIRVISTDVFLAVRAQMPPDYGYANALSVVMVIVMGILLVYYSRLSRNADRYQVITGQNYRPARLDIGRWRGPVGLVSLVFFLVIVVVPVVVLILISFLPFYRGVFGIDFTQLTFANYISALNKPALIEGAANTLFLCFTAAIVAVAVACLAAWFVARRAPGGVLLDQVLSLPLVFPGIVLGMTISQVALQAPIPLYGTRLVLGVAYFITFLPFAMRFTYAGILQIQLSLEESALVAGASYRLVYRRIILPLLLPAAFIAGMFVFLDGVRSLSMPILLASPRSPIAATSLYDLWLDGGTTEVAAFGVIWTVFMVSVAMLFFISASRRNIKIF